MISTVKIGAVVGGLAVPILGLLAAFSVIHWDVAQAAVVVSLWGVSTALLTALIEHFRGDTPSRWVAVMNLIGPEAIAILATLFTFGAITDVKRTAILAVVAAILGPFGVKVSQDKVYSQETYEADLRAASNHAPK